MIGNSVPARSENILGKALRYYWLSIAGIIIYAALDAILQLLPPHYSPIRDAESDLAVGPYGILMSINFVNRGLLSISFIFALSKTVRAYGKGESFKTGNVLLLIWAVGSAILAFFPTDVPATPMSWHGAIHFVVAIIAFIGGAFGTLILSRHLNDCEATKDVKKIAMVIAALALLFWAAEFFTPFVLAHFASRFGGLLERLFLGSVLLWILVISVHVVRNKGIQKETTLDRPITH